MPYFYTEWLDHYRHAPLAEALRQARSMSWGSELPLAKTRAAVQALIERNTTLLEGG
jgi:hypothetical protein